MHHAVNEKLLKQKIPYFSVHKLSQSTVSGRERLIERTFHCMGGRSKREGGIMDFLRDFVSAT